MKQFFGLDVAQVLQVGFTGFGFLLALLAFWIITKEQRKTPPSDKILGSANRFMLFSLALAALSICAPFAKGIADRRAEVKAVADSVAAATSAAAQSVADMPIAVRPAAEPHVTYLIGHVEDTSGPLENVLVSLNRSESSRGVASSGPAGASSATSNAPVVVKTAKTDQLGEFDLGEVQFGSPNDHYTLDFDAPHHRKQRFILGPSGALNVRTYMAVSNGSGDRP